MRTSGRRSGVIGLVATAVLAGCSTPIQVEPLNAREAHRELTSTVLSTDRPSDATQNTLRARGLLENAEEDPVGTLRALHELVTSGSGGQDEIFALAELSFFQGLKTQKREDYLAAAVYAWAYLFPGTAAASPSHFDPRTRQACDLYNHALASAFRAAKRGMVEPTGGIYELPFAQLEIELEDQQLLWAGRRLVDFIDVSQIQIKGLRNRYREPGLGAPLAARTAPAADTDPDELVGPRILAPVTLVLHLGDARGSLGSGRLRGRLEIFSLTRDDAFDVDGQRVPLELERSAALAETLSNPMIWKSEIWGFLGRLDVGGNMPELPILRAVSPHAPGRIPVVFVHGTASSAGRWADMVNDLWSSQSLRQRFEPWFFMYDTGNPIAYSGDLLRTKLSEAVDRLDAVERDPCLHEMVVIGHSQGGLLTKLTAVDTGDQLWNAISSKPFEEMELSDETRTLLQRSLFIKPMPFVRRVVFIATPHRGSYQALRTIAGWVTRFIRMPGRLAGVARDLSLNPDSMRAAGAVLKIPTSVDNMRAGNPFLMALASIPVAPGIGHHSIIPVRGDGPFETGNDGVVEYRSAHLDDADSELVVHSGHSTQALPATIEEVRRILELHADALAANGLICGAS